MLLLQLKLSFLYEIADKHESVRVKRFKKQTIVSSNMKPIDPQVIKANYLFLLPYIFQFNQLFFSSVRDTTKFRVITKVRHLKNSISMTGSLEKQYCGNEKKISLMSIFAKLSLSPSQAGLR